MTHSMQICSPYPIPQAERERLAALYAFDILDTTPERSFDSIVHTAARLFNAPIALVSLVDAERQWFKAKLGLTVDETSRDVSFCSHAMLQRQPMVICDATKDPRFQDNPLVTGEMSIRFYVGAPLRTRDGLPLGSLCVIDSVVRERPSQALLDSLSDLAFLVVEQLEFRAAVAAKTRAELARRQAEERYQLLAETARDAFLIVNEVGVIAVANNACRSLLGYTQDELTGELLRSVVPAYVHLPHSGLFEAVALHKSGVKVPVEISFSEFHRGELMHTAILRDITERHKTEQALRDVAEKLSQSLAEKETLLREVHHRVKNNLQVISSLLTLQADTVTDAGAAIALKESQRRVFSMAMVHERLCNSQKLDEIDFAAYLQTVVRELFHSYASASGKVVSRVEATPVRLRMDQAIPCGLILNELVTNALKYAYPDGSGEVLIGLTYDPDDNIQLTVSDRGAGLPEGFDVKSTKSLGMRIVHVLSRQLGGQLSVRSRPGTEFRLVFPLGRK
jgi:PAS domain S-box-containing protein